MNSKGKFSTHYSCLKGYLEFNHFIKYEYVGVPWDALDYLFWNFESINPVAIPQADNYVFIKKNTS